MKAERRIISERRMIQYIPGGFFKICKGVRLREKMEGAERVETFFSAL